MLGFILFLIVIGLIGGFVARALVPGRDAMTVGALVDELMAIADDLDVTSA